MVLTEEEFNYYRSEEYAKKREAEEGCWHAAYDNMIQDTLDRFDAMLGETDHASLSGIAGIFEDDAFGQTYARSRNMVYMHMFYVIYRQEQEENIRPNIFDIGESFQHLLFLMQTIRFFVWRYEFCEEWDALALLWDFCTDNRMSSYAVLNLAMTAAFHREDVFGHLVGIMEGDEHGQS
ncbi:MAG: hypothetical protein K2G89_07390 [Lachnospiraceae bacterium]|nr:hypothetical protein [Lachnospiraceae bacterium]